MYAEKTECSKISNMEIFYTSVHVFLYLLNELMKIDNMRGSAKGVIIYH